VWRPSQSEAAGQCDKLEEPKNAGPLSTSVVKAAHDADWLRDMKAAHEPKAEREGIQRPGSLAAHAAGHPGTIASSYVMALPEAFLRALTRRPKA
jgi:hypothetical protein